MKKLIYLILFLFLSQLVVAQNWVALGSGMNNIVYEFVSYNGELYAAGQFTTAGGISANRVAKWDGTDWSALGTGVDNTVFELRVFNGQLYVGGLFSIAGGVPASNIAIWNGTTWSAVGSGMNGNVIGSAIYNGELYVCGGFTTAGGNPANYVARWNGTTWSDVGTGMNGLVRGLLVHNAELYAGGDFTTAGGITANRIAKWDGNSWTAVGTGMDNNVFDALTSYNSDLCVGGTFTQAGGAPANRLAKWNGSTWSDVGGSVTGASVRDVANYNDELIVGGSFSMAGSLPVNNIAKWDGTNWSTFGSGMNDVVQTLYEYNSELYAGGFFTTAGGNTVNRVAKWGTCDVPGQPGPISGNTTVCSGTSQTYSVSPVTGATTYTWTLPSGWTGTSTTTSITTTVGTNSGNVSVTANNSCGSSTAQTLAVTVNLTPAQPGTISGNNPVCQGSSQTYSIIAVTGATSYTWTLPSGWTGSSTSTSIMATVGANSGSISVTANNSCGSSPAQTLAVTVVNSIPAQPGAINGINSVCQGSSQTYSISAVSGATSYTWTLPPTWTGSSTTTSITATVGANSGNISVMANNICGSSTAQTLAVTVNTTPVQPGTISGNNSVCQGSSQTYSIDVVSGASSYSWTLPSGWTGSSTTTTIDVTVGANSGNISVTANNSCGTSSVQILAVSVTPAPAQPGAISGSNAVCQSSSQTYSISAVSGASSYSWTLPSGWTGSSSTTSITATVGTNSGNISVTANNGCDSSLAQTLAVTVNSTPAQPGPISGNNSVCLGSAQNYIIDAINGATSYTWILPSGWTGTSTTTSITAIVGANSGNISVMSNNSCGSSTAQTLAVIVNTVLAQPGPISGNILVCQGSSQTYSIDTVSGATSYTWTLPSGWTGSSTTNSITATVGASGGNISVMASNSCGSSPAQNLVATVDPLPAQPDTISGNLAVCQGSGQTYTVSEVSGATSYTWTLPTEWTGTSTTTSITSTVGAIGGNISVTANNSCGSSPAQILPVTVNSIPVQPDTINGNTFVCPASSQTYTINPIQGAASYTWTLPPGWTGSSTSASITALVGANGGNISVAANNNCGSSGPQTLVVTVVNAVPSQPGDISGNNTICQGSTQTYSIDEVVGASSYSWTLPPGGGWTGSSTTTSITTTAGVDGGTISVIANNGCGGSMAQTLEVTVNPVPTQPGAISGNIMATVGQTLNYSISPVNGATGYNWSLSGGGNIIEGMNTESIAINWLTAGNYILSINATNSCGMSSNQTLNITVSLGTGVNDPDDPHQININPNPSEGEFYLTAKGVINKLICIQIFSLSGQLIYSGEQRAGTNNYSQLINLGHVAIGVYIVKIRIAQHKYFTTIALIN